MDELTTEQRFYCELRARNMDQSTAYKIAFNRPNLKKSSLSAMASKLEQQDNILIMIDRFSTHNFNDDCGFNKQVFIDELSELFYTAMADVEIHGINGTNANAVYKALDRIVDINGLLPDAQNKHFSSHLQTKILEAKLKNINDLDVDQTKAIDTLIARLDS